MTITDTLMSYRLAVCVGAGGVGKTTIAAALALDAAHRGRRALVLTIDPARALARALGLERLTGDRQRVAVAGLAPPAMLDAAMLDHKRAWDAFVARHAPDPATTQALLANPFYQRLSTSLAGSTDYMAIEEMCRFVESGDYDLIVLDTPPAAHAFDFVRAPDRIDRLLDVRSHGWVAMSSASATARMVIRALERATGRRTLRDIATFLATLDALVAGMRARTQRARALLRGGEAAFVLVAAPRRLELADTEVLVRQLAALSAPLAGVIVNRVHWLPAVAPEASAREFAALGDSPAARWLARVWSDLVAEADGEASVIADLAAIAPTARIAQVPEAGHDLHSLADLALVVEALNDAAHGGATSMLVGG